MRYHDKHDTEPVASREAVVKRLAAIVFVSVLLLLMDIDT